MFSGLEAACEDLRRSGDRFFDSQKLFDLRIMSTLGLTEEDVTEVSGVPGVALAEGGWMETADVQAGDSTVSVTFQELQELFNCPYLLDGRLPEKPDEIAVTQKFLDDNGVKLGDRLTVREEKEDKEGDEEEEIVFEEADSALRYTSFRIVGVVTDPMEVNNTASGTVSFRSASTNTDSVFVLPEAFDTDLYAVIWIRLADAETAFCYDDSYRDLADRVRKQIESEIMEDRERARYDEVTGDAREKIEDAEEEAQEELADARAELEDGEKTLQKELADAEAELKDGEQQLSEGRKELEEGETELNAQEQLAESQLAAAWQQLNAQRQQLDQADAELQQKEAEAWPQIEEGEQKLAAGREELEQKKTEIQEQFAAARAEISAGKEQLESGIAQADAGIQQLEEGLAGIAVAADPLETARQQAEEALAGLQSAQAAAEEALAGLQSAVAAAEAAVADLQNKGAPAEEIEAAQQNLAALRQQAEAAGQQAAAAGQQTAEVQQQLQQIAEQQGTLAQQKAELESQLAVAGEQRTELQTQLAALQQSETELDGQEQAAQEQLTVAEEELTAQETQLQEQRTALESARTQIDDGRAQLQQGEAVYNQQANQARNQIASARAEIEENRKKLEESEKELEEGRADYEEGRKEGEEELAEGWEEYRKGEAEAEEKLADARARLRDIEMADWYVQDRTSLGGYANIGSDADSIEAIAQVFPIVFFIVAILISLTTIARMVEEDRGLIGTYKALGFTDREIRRKYLVYTGSAGMLGSLIGSVIAFILLPKFIFWIFSTMYLLPAYRYTFLPSYGLAGVLLFIGGVMIAALLACRSELRHTPAELMRPRAPKPGMRVFLERIRPVWKRLSFLNKITARNLFRYKGRLLMTIAGIAGCTALLLFGFAIGDSVHDLLPRQYEQTMHYDLLAVTAPDDIEVLRGAMQNGEIESYLEAGVTSVILQNEEGRELDAQLIVLPQEAALEEYITTEDLDGRIRTVQDGEVLVTQNAGNVLALGAGETFRMQLPDLEHAEPAVTALVKNYLGNYVFMTAATWETWFDSYEPNAVFARFSETCRDQKVFCDMLSEQEGVLTCVSTQELKGNFDASFALINMVVYVVIVMSAALAFVVLFTLATTNISERQRELATIKVLGFYDSEVHRYINKETLILTGIGIVIGIPLGWAFAQTLTSILNLPAIYLAVSLHPVSYFISAALSLGFSLIVNAITDRTLNRIDPVEALKSVE